MSRRRKSSRSRSVIPDAIPQKTSDKSPSLEDTGEVYDPRKRPPTTLGELHRWMLAQESDFRRNVDSGLVPLNPPPISGLDQLSAYCQSKWRERLSEVQVRCLISDVVLASQASFEEAATISLQEAANILIRMLISSPMRTDPTSKTSPVSKDDLESLAIVLLNKHRDWSIPRVADHLGVDRRTLYKWPKFKQFAELIGVLKPRRLKDRNPRRGHKTSDGRIEAYSDDEDE